MLIDLYIYASICIYTPLYICICVCMYVIHTQTHTHPRAGQYQSIQKFKTGRFSDIFDFFKRGFPSLMNNR